MHSSLLSEHVLVWAEGKMTTEKSWQMQNYLASTQGKIYNIFYLFGSCKIPLFLWFRVIVLPRGSFFQWGVIKSPKEKKIVHKLGPQRAVWGRGQKPPSSLMKDGLWSNSAGQLGGKRAWRWRAFSLKSAKSILEGWLCPSLAFWPWASYLTILSLSLHLCRLGKAVISINLDVGKMK